MDFARSCLFRASQRGRGTAPRWGAGWLSITFLLVSLAETSHGNEFPRPKVAGFQPLVAITTSDRKRGEDLEWEHDLHFGYAGNPLSGTPETDYVVGVLDTGAVANVIAGEHAEKLGVTSSLLTNNIATLVGFGNCPNVDASVSHPFGFFSQGLAAISENSQLDRQQLFGHSNVSNVVLPEIEGSTPRTVLGLSMLSFFTSVIRNDVERTVRYEGEDVTSPDVQIYAPGDQQIPVFGRSIPLSIMGLGGLPATTAAFYGLTVQPLDLQTPQTPTILTSNPISIPTGGNIFAEVGIGHGELGPTNPIQTVDLILDTGAQGSILSRAAAARLNIDLQNPDFVVDIETFGCTTPNVPGFYIDYMRINASGGAVEFSHAPFIILDIPSPNGGVLDGVLGMNAFWNRNLVLEPSLLGSSFLHISEPLFGPEVLLGDVDLDLDRDAADIDDLYAHFGGDIETTDPAIYDLNVDFDVNQADVDYLVRNLMGSEFGDSNLDGEINLDDFSSLKQSFGNAGGWANGDFTGDEMIDLADFNLLKSNFGFQGNEMAASVPEPGSLCLAISGLAAVAFAVRHRRTRILLQGG